MADVAAAALAMAVATFVIGSVHAHLVFASVHVGVVFTGFVVLARSVVPGLLSAAAVLAVIAGAVAGCGMLASRIALPTVRMSCGALGVVSMLFVRVRAAVRAVRVGVHALAMSTTTVWTSGLSRRVSLVGCVRPYELVSSARGISQVASSLVEKVVELARIGGLEPVSRLRNLTPELVDHHRELGAGSAADDEQIGLGWARRLRPAALAQGSLGGEAQPGRSRRDGQQRVRPRAG